jgi:2-oxoisovalerate dehydrogenase E1 component
MRKKRRLRVRIGGTHRVALGLMSLERFRGLHDRLLALTEMLPGARDRPGLGDADRVMPESPLTAVTARELLESQLTARHLDVVAYELRARGEGFYTISSAGHEGNVVLGRLLEPSDLALLHYRSGALFVERARKRPHVDAVDCVTLGLTASSEDPISGGRHKVFGSMALGVLPQTSTIASQLPKAVGLALSLERARRLGRTPRVGDLDIPAGAIVLTSLGDASINHASATVAINAARWVTHQKLRLPLLIVCEDNEIGLSVRSPSGWTRAVLSAGPSLPYFEADGWDLAQSWEVASRAVALCRERRCPVVLHLHCVRLMGHSGADPDTTYRTRAELEAAAERDPVLCSARMLVERGVISGQGLFDLDAEIAERVWRSAARAIATPKLSSAAQIAGAVADHEPARVHAEAARADYQEARLVAFGGAAQLPEAQKPQPMGRLINWALFDLLAKYPHALVFGEDVAEKGGVYNITAGLWKRFGAGRVFNTLLDETTILGLAQGAASAGLLPVPEIQYLAFLHNAEDQLRGEAASTSFFSRGQLKSPMVLRVASFGYQRGFGGHFHNDNSIAVLRDIPGLRIAAPSNGGDAVGLLRTLFASAQIEGRVCVFLEPIALYHERDLLPGDAKLASAYPPPGYAIEYGQVGVYGGEAKDLTIATYGNGVRIGRRAALTLAREHGIAARVVDLRWLAPLPYEAVLEHARATRRLLFVDECRRAGNAGEAVLAEIGRSDRSVAIDLVTAHDSYVPLGDAAMLILPSERDVIDAALGLCKAAV